jgi:hypothetical protein
LVRQREELRWPSPSSRFAFIDGETDSYLLGTRWKLNDTVAAAFAGAFYRALLIEQKPLGQAIVESRLAVRAARANDLGWASNIYYGDPRLWFRRRPGA